MTQTNLGVVIGSLRRDGLSARLARAMIAMAPQAFHYKVIEIGDLPLYNPDLDDQGSAAWERFRTQLCASDAVLFVTPEYNRSIPGALKNAIDVGSRPYGKSAWAGKPAGIVSLSQGAIGGFGANHHLRQCLVFLDMAPMQQPEAYLGAAQDMLDADGGLRAEAETFLRNWLAAFSAHVQRQQMKV